ncbi:hypothetical protein BWR00_02020, partial [Pseudomonas aeruginosa]
MDWKGTAHPEQGTIHASKRPEIHLRRWRREPCVRCRRVRTGRSALRAFPPEPEAGQRQERHRFQAGTRPAGHPDRRVLGLAQPVPAARRGRVAR